MIKVSPIARERFGAGLGATLQDVLPVQNVVLATTIAQRVIVYDHQNSADKTPERKCVGDACPPACDAP
jgi:hypothetical protein